MEEQRDLHDTALACCVPRSEARGLPSCWLSSWADKGRVPAHRSDDLEPTRAAEARQAPEPKTADELTAEQRERRLGRREGAVAILFLLVVVASHIAVHIPRIGTWAALALVIALVGFSLFRTARASPDDAQDGGSFVRPLRVIFLFWLAVSVASVVLVSLDSFSRENVLLLAVVWSIALVLWLGDRGLARVMAKR
jgi:hypothetical protein